MGKTKLKMAERGQMYIAYKECKSLHSIIKKISRLSLKKMKQHIKTISKINS